MAKRKGSSKRPQRQHKRSKKSQHDKRKRLDLRNPDRRKTTEAVKQPQNGMRLLTHFLVNQKTVGLVNLGLPARRRLDSGRITSHQLNAD